MWPPAVLALDLGTKTGRAVGRAVDCDPARPTAHRAGERGRQWRQRIGLATRRTVHPGGPANDNHATGKEASVVVVGRGTSRRGTRNAWAWAALFILTAIPAR